MKQVILKTSVMKQVIVLIAVAAVVAVATIGLVNSSKSKKVDATAIELAQFEAWKAEQAEKQNALAVVPVKTAAKATTARRAATKTYTSPKMVSETQYPAQTTTKKGWSKAAKGAVIGGVVGAAGGAVINKRNRAAGAVIGGVVGAGGGYVIGRTMDKKDGRY